MNKKILNVSILVLFALDCHLSLCMPLDDEYNGDLDKKTIEQLRKCDMDMATMELCMRCAKVTKSTIVYPLCCANEDKIKDWCHDYVFFGAL